MQQAILHLNQKLILVFFSASQLSPSFPFLFWIINEGAKIGQLRRSHMGHNVQEDYWATMIGYMRHNRRLAHWRQSTHDMHFCNVQMS